VVETYSTYEAKAKLSEILRKVESGKIIRIARRGEPIAEIRGIQRAPATLAERLRDLQEQGVLTRPTASIGRLRPVARRRGALRRFLADRSE
jgi:prevent-host-death family protein